METKDPQNQLILWSDLSSVEQQRVEGLFRPIFIQGQVYGLIPGASTWHRRLVVEEQGELYLYRFSDPCTGSTSVLYDELLVAFQRASRLGYFTQFSELDTHGVLQVWFKRPFYRGLLDGAPVASLGARQSMVRRICAAVRELHSVAVVHGNICPANIAFERGRVVLLDIGMRMHSPTHQRDVWSVAPEVQRGALASAQTDIHALAAVIQSLLGKDELTSEQTNCLEQMVAADLARRPSAERVEDIFGAGASSSQVKVEGSTSLTSGILAKDQSQVTTAKLGYKVVPANYQWLLNILLVVLVGSGAWFIYGYLDGIGLFRNSARYVLEWRQGTTDQRFEVADLAARGNESAQRAICTSAQSGVQVFGVDQVALRIGCDDRWYNDFTAGERKLLFWYSMRGFLGAAEVAGMWGNKYHPALVLATLATSEDGAVAPEFLQNTSVLHMATLPSELGTSFRILAGLEIANVRDSSVVAWSKILSKQFTVKTFKQFLFTGQATSDVGLFTKLDLLYKLFADEPVVLKGVYKLLLAQDSKVAEVLTWFEDEPLDLWNAASPQLKLGLVVNQIPQDFRNSAQLIDLILFPRKTVREDAAARVAAKLVSGPAQQVLTSFFLEGGQVLSRAQLVSMVSMFLSEAANNNLNLIRNWFSTEPDPNAVAQLILARDGTLRGKDALEVFEIEAAVYLSSKVGEFVLPIAITRQLAAHPEIQVRTLAYQLLNPALTDQREVLKSLVELEPNERLRESVKSRIRAFGGLA